MSVEYYAKLERGALAGVSAGVLDALARALQLDDAERTHLLHLAHEADGTAPPRPAAASRGVDGPTQPAMGPGHHHRRRRSSATTGRICSPPTTSAEPCTPTSTPTREPAQLRPLHVPRQRRPPLLPRLGLAADMCVANLRTAAGKDPHDKGLHDLVGELSTRSDEFRRRWGAHNVRTHGAGVKHFHHHIVGDLELAYESLDLRAEPGLTMTIYSAEPGSPTAHALALLASWSATEAAPRTTDQRTRLLQSSDPS